MKYKTVSALCEGIAGAIREKEGSSARINPQDFVDRIKGLEVGGGASGSKWRYLKRIGWLPSAGGGDIAIYSAMSQVVRYEDSRWSDDGSVKAMIETGSQALLSNGIYPIAFGFDPNTIIFDPRYDAEKQTLWEKLLPIFQTEGNCFEPITEEQFYDTTTFLIPQEITFTVSGVEYTALSGMTWEEFCNSEYNDGGWGKLFFDCEALGDGKISASDSGMDAGVVQLNGSNVYKTDTIQPNANYTTSNPLG